MSWLTSQNQNVGLFVPTTQVWDSTRINQIDVNSPDFKVLLVSMYQDLNNFAIALNQKDSAIYDLLPFVTGGQWFTPGNNKAKRGEYRITINFGALPNTGTKSVAHGITCTSTTTFTQIYATASDTTDFEYIGFSYSPDDEVSLSVDGTNVTVTTKANYSNYNICYIVLKYLLN
jgi:hypothetical protein